MILLFTDTHFDDNPSNEYRWRTFEHVRNVARERAVSHIYHLGDFVDRKDRFSSVFVNRLIHELIELSRVAPVSILRGNHDSPLCGPPFFDFLNRVLTDVHYVTEITARGPLLLLPFTPSPLEDWASIRFSDYRAALAHVTVTGAVSESGYTLTGGRLPLLPPRLRFYSGDVHVPQRVRNVTYVGCPHPVRFGDDFPCRLLLLSEDTFEIAEEIALQPPRKRVLEVSSLDEVRLLAAQTGDQVRIKFHLSPEDVVRWAQIEGDISAWAREAGVSVVGVEALIEQPRLGIIDLDIAPETILRQFASEEEVADGLLSVGLDLLREAAG